MGKTLENNLVNLAIMNFVSLLLATVFQLKFLALSPIDHCSPLVATKCFALSMYSYVAVYQIKSYISNNKV